MKKINDPIITLCMLFFSFSLFANGGNDELLNSSITLCSGKKMTWEEYLEMKKCKEEEYDLEIESVEAPFVPFDVSMMNNTQGAWSSVVSMPLVAAAAAQMPDGRVLTWSAKDKFSFGGANGRTWTAIFDPATNSSQEALIENTGHDMFCPGISTLPDGRIIVDGGSNSDQTSIYDPFTGGWSNADNLNLSRGYHSNVSLASGATFTIGGSWSGGVGNKHAEVWTEKTGWYRLPGVPVDAVIEGLNSSQPTQHDDYFPWLWTAPNGKIFHAGPNQRMHWIDPTGYGSYSYAGTRGNDLYAVSGTTVMYDVGKILKAGGSNTFEEQTNASSRCYSIDFNQDNVQVDQMPNLNYPRVYHNSVVLPTGEVIVLGGIPISNVFSDNNSVLVPELWNPNTQTWTEMAAMATPRNYHSVSLLMKDGRVFIAGGGLCGSCSTNHADAEIYSPPYLFNPNGTLATRPQLTSVPPTANNNSTITVNTNSSVNSFALVRASAVTHSTNNEQRRIPVTFSSLGNNQYNLSILNRNILPPGNYMLFAMNANGTPSIAEIINIGDDLNDCTPQSNPNLGGSGLSATYFNNSNLTSPILDRVDSAIDFEWGTGAPDPSIDANTFSVRWEGGIEVPRSGPYTFYTNSDDGVRLWVDDKLMVDNWTDHGPTEDIGMILLEEGQSYDIRLEYYESAGDATIQLSWSGPGILKQIIPTGNLFSNDPCLGAGSPSISNVSSTDSECDQDDGSISISFNDNPNRSNIEFSIDGGTTWPAAYNVLDNSGAITINNLSPGNYSLWARWGNDECPGAIQSVNIDEVNCGGGGTCDDITLSGANGTIAIGGLDFPHINIQVYTSTWDNYFDCVDNCPEPFTLSNVPAGGYILLIKTFDANWQTVCNLTETLTVTGGGGGCPDNDNDGVCQQDDCNDSDPNVPTTVGSPCDDGNSNTSNDVIQSDGCTCAGETNGGGGGTCDDITLSGVNGTITIGGLDFPHINIQVYTSTWDGYFNCVDNCPEPFTLNNVPAGGYILLIKTFDANWQTVCNLTETLTVTGGGGGCPDNDNDGICQQDDCNDSDPNLPAAVGSSCDDGNSNTSNDVIQNDGCTCAGETNGGGGGCSANLSGQNGSISISGVSAPIFTVQVFNSGWQTIYSCFGDCNSPTVIDNLSNGDYIVKLNLYDANWNSICEINETVTVGSSGFQSNTVSEYLILEAFQRATYVDLRWTINTDYNTEHFEIQKSSDGINFQTLKDVISTSQSYSAIYYTNEDLDPEIGHNYYRIVQHFNDGSQRFSFVELAYFNEKPETITVYPNPNNGRLLIDVSKLEGRAFDMIIYGVNGDVFIERHYDQDHGIIVEEDLSKMMNGIYQVYIKAEDRKAITKRVILTRTY